jgi:LTXXQ motif family protein
MKVIAAGLAALFITVSPLAHAQQTSTAGQASRLSQTDMNALTDARIIVVKSALQLTPDQEKYWPAIEQAIRQRAKDRQERIEGVVARTTEGRAQGGPVETLQNRNPVEFMQRRAENMERRAADLKKLADAWQPLYQALTPDQKRRMAALSIVALRDTVSGIEQRRMMDD